MVEHVRRIVPDSFVCGDPELRRRILSQCDVNLDKAPPPRLLSPDFSLVNWPVKRRRLKRLGRVKVGQRLEKPSVPSERQGRLLEGNIMCSESLAVMQKGGGFARNRDFTAGTAPTKRITPIPSLVSLHVKGLHNETFSLNVSSGQEARAVYEAVEQHTGIPTCDQLLMISGHKVFPLLSLNDQGITAGSTLHLSLPLRGGADNPPTDGLTDKRLGRLARKIRADWKAVGRELNISYQQLKEIEAANPCAVECANEMLQTWLRNTSEHSDRVDELLTALREAELTDIAEEFERQLSAAKTGQGKTESSANGTSIKHIGRHQQQKRQVSVQHTADEGGTEVKSAEASPASSNTSAKASPESSPCVNDFAEKPASDGPGAVSSATDKSLSGPCLNDALEMVNGELVARLLLVNGILRTHQDENSSQMAFLSKLHWNAVLDFDPNSEINGLYKAIINSPSPLRFEIMMVSKYLDKAVVTQPSQIGLDSTVQPWVFVNGRQGLDPETLSGSFVEWMTKESDPETLAFVQWMTTEYEALEAALRVYRDYCPCLATILVLSSDQALKHVAATLERLASLGFTASTKTASRLLIVITVTEDLREKLLAGVPRLSDMLRPHCFVATLDEMSRIFTEVGNSGPCPAANLAVSEFLRLPRSDGSTIAVPPAIAAQWVDLHVLSSCQFEDKNTIITESMIINAANEFYKGHEVTWLNFYLGHDVNRSQSRDFLGKILSHAEEVRKLPISEKKSPYLSTVHVVKLIYESGTGGTTLARRLLWDLRREYRCAVIQCLSIMTCNSIKSFHRYGEQPAMKPAILLIDQEPLMQLRYLVEHLELVCARCVILFVQPQHSDYSASLPRHRQPETPDGTLQMDELVLKSELDKSEKDSVKTKITTLEDREKRNKAVQAVEKTGLFIYAGLELFGQQYNEKRLVKFVDDRLGSNQVTDRQRHMLEFCSLVFFFIHKSIPRGCLNMHLPGMQFYQGFEVEHFCTAGLLVKCEDTWEQSCVYPGYRPAHVRTAELILQHKDKRPLDQICEDFLDKLLTGSSHATHTLWELTVALFIRKTFSPNSHFDSDDPDRVEVEELPLSAPPLTRQRHPHSQDSGKVSRFTTLVSNILDQNDERGSGISKALRILTLLSKKAKDRGHPCHAFTWEVISRLMSLRVADSQLPSDIAEKVNSLMDGIALPAYPPGHGGAETPTLKPISGFEAAVVCIEQALLIKPNHSTLLTTKGNVLKHRLASKYATCKPKSEFGWLAVEIRCATQVGKDACQAFEEARRGHRDNWHATVGDIETCLYLLRTLKSSEDLKSGYPSADCLHFLHGEELPRKLLNHLAEGGLLGFLLSLDKRVRTLVDGFYAKEHLVKEGVYGEEAEVKWQKSYQRVKKLEKAYWTLLADVQGLDNGSSSQQCEKKICRMLSLSSYSPYSSWRLLLDETMHSIIQSLLPLAQKGKVTNHGSMTALVRACLECENAPADIDLQQALPAIITIWVNKCKSLDGEHEEWAHLFNYIIHFIHVIHDQAPDWADPNEVKESLKVCQQSVRSQEMHGGSFRRPKPKYFLTKKPKESGFPLIPARRVGGGGKDPDFRSEYFWRKPAVSDDLQRLCGFKKDVGLISFGKFQLKFNNDLYPNRGEDRVYFYVGFTFHGLHAFDPISEVEYRQLSPPALPVVKLEIPPDQQFPRPAGASKAKGNTDQMAVQPSEADIHHQQSPNQPIPRRLKMSPALRSSGPTPSVNAPHANVGAEAVKDMLSQGEVTSSRARHSQGSGAFRQRPAIRHLNQPAYVSAVVQNPIRKQPGEEGRKKSTGREPARLDRGYKSRQQSTKQPLGPEVVTKDSESPEWETVKGRKGKVVGSQSRSSCARTVPASSSLHHQQQPRGDFPIKLSNRYSLEASPGIDSSSDKEHSADAMCLTSAAACNSTGEASQGKRWKPSEHLFQELSRFFSALEDVYELADVLLKGIEKIDGRAWVKSKTSDGGVPNPMERARDVFDHWYRKSRDPPPDGDRLYEVLDKILPRVAEEFEEKIRAGGD